MNRISLSVAALIPALLLCWYIYEKDRKEKEPFSLLVLLFLMGACVFVPAIYLENTVIGLWDKIMVSQMEFSLSGVAEFKSKGAHILHSALCGFLAIGLIEEAVKWLVLHFVIRKNENFDHLFDGIVYAVFVSLGFAAVENVFYAVRDGWGVFVLRSLTSVPGHMTFGVLMGFCYTMWNTYFIAEKLEKQYERDGMIELRKPYHSLRWLLGSLVLPAILHGFYSFMSFFKSDVMIVLFYILIIILYIFCFIGTHRVSVADTEENKAAYSLLFIKYPTLSSSIKNSSKR